MQEKIENKEKKYYVPIFYTNNWEKKYFTEDLIIVSVEPKLDEIKKFNTWITAKNFGFKKWKEHNFKGYVIKEVICPITD